MDIGAKEVILVLVGFCLSWAPQWFDRRRRIRAHWAALRAEAVLCVEKGNILRNDGIAAPLYRFPTLAFERALPVLLADGELAEEESLNLSRYLSQVQDMNRGLDNATAMHQASDSTKLDQEYRRNLAKATELVKGANDDGGLAQSAINVINGRLGSAWWKR